MSFSNGETNANAKMSKASDKDNILKRLKEESFNGPLELKKLSFFNDPFYELLSEYWRELQHDGYINYVIEEIPPYDSTAPLLITLVSKEEVYITDKGIIFIDNGGYTAIEQKELEAIQQQNKDRLFNRLNVVIAFCAFVVATISLIYSCQTSKGTSVQEKTIDSLKSEIKTLTDSLRKK